ncbi:response regulator [Chamaesiphon sp.]|uniref:response regulator n=1 Tax=Chamaesiphon sp. TaxID=2814140 RepID=UPI0035935588
MSDIRVILVEDHDVVRIGLRTVLQIQSGIQVVGEATTGPQGLALLQNTEVDVALVDIGLPGMDGIELTQKFRQYQKQQPTVATKVIMLTMLGSEETVIAAFAAGADSYCMKDVGIEQLIEAINMTHSGNAWIDPAIASIVLRQMRQSISQPNSSKQTIEIRSLEPEYEQVLASDPVTEREREVLELMVAGCTNVAIAERLFITVGTVKTHVRNILAKLCADDRTEAAVRALRSGIIS